MSTRRFDNAPPVGTRLAPSGEEQHSASAAANPMPADPPVAQEAAPAAPPDIESQSVPSEIPQPPAAQAAQADTTAETGSTPEAVPQTERKPHKISLQKGQKIDLTKGHPGLSKLLIGLGWDVNPHAGGDDFDLDASAFLLDAQGKAPNEHHFVFYNNVQDPSGAVMHTGDNQTGEGEGDDEQIIVDLTKIPENIDKVDFTVTIYEAEERGQNFGQVANAFIRVVDLTNNEELLRFDLGEDFSVETAVVAGQVYRYEDEWKFSAVGGGFEGGLEALVYHYGLAT